MKTVLVQVTINMDIHEGDLVEQTTNALEAINEALTAAHLNCEPQILTGNISKSDIEVNPF